MFSLSQEPIIQEIKPTVNPNNIRLFIKREDLIHPIISGNKWRKLKYNLEEAKKKKFKTLLTFGGAYSNHIHALAGAAYQYGFKSIGIIRGEEHLPLNPTLKESTAMGMELYYLDRATYRDKHTRAVQQDLEDLFGEFYLVPEGGTNELAIRGAEEIVSGIEENYDYYIVACGTAGTVTGMISGIEDKGKTLGIAVLKGDFLEKEVAGWLKKTNKHYLSNWEIITKYHFGGYAKFTDELISFINNFKSKHKVPLDPIYTGKMMMGVIDLIAQGYFEPKSSILAIHTGGLQGIKGFNTRFNNIIDF